MIPAEEIIANMVAPRLQEMAQQLATAKANMDALLKHAGKAATCRGCDAPIVFVKHADSGRWTPYNQDGSNHFVTCPQRDRFRKPVRPAEE